MSNNGESRESLDLLASAAEQSSPQSRIKRNTACVSCRDSSRFQLTCGGLDSSHIGESPDLYQDHRPTTCSRHASNALDG